MLIFCCVRASAWAIVTATGCFVKRLFNEYLAGRAVLSTVPQSAFLSPVLGRVSPGLPPGMTSLQFPFTEHYVISKNRPTEEDSAATSVPRGQLREAGPLSRGLRLGLGGCQSSRGERVSWC